MNKDFQWMPDQASSLAPQVDHLYYFLVAVTVFFTVLIFVMIVYLGLKYRRKSEVMPPGVHGNLTLEVVWTIVPFVFVIIMFAWSSSLFVRMSKPPESISSPNFSRLARPGFSTGNVQCHSFVPVWAAYAVMPVGSVV